METKPFYKTSEFWGIMIAELTAVIASTPWADVLPPEWLPIISAFLAALYAVSRGLAKAGVDPHAKTTVSVPAEHSAQVSVQGSPEKDIIVPGGYP